MQKAIVIYGPPGSGKSTQAELLARRHNFIHFDTGRYIAALVHSPEAKRDPVLRRERANYDAGRLCTPSWVLKITLDNTRSIHKAGYGIVFSGSPRTVPEAFGEKDKKGLATLLLDLYGKKNVTAIALRVSPETSIKRNLSRFVCSTCGLPILVRAKVKRCAFCDGYVKKRSDDDREIMKVRLKEYRERTYPILKGMKSRGFKVSEINGEPLPYKVLSSLERTLKLGE